MKQCSISKFIKNRNFGIILIYFGKFTLRNAVNNQETSVNPSKTNITNTQLSHFILAHIEIIKTDLPRISTNSIEKKNKIYQIT